MPVELGVAIGALLLSVVTIVVARRVAEQRHWFDQPNARSAHARPTARIGGVGIVVSFIAGGGSILIHHHTLDCSTAIGFAGIAATAILGFADDLLRIRAIARLIIQLSITATVVVLLRHFGATPLLTAGGVMGWLTE